MPTTLLPISQRMNANAHSLSETSLREPDKAPERRDVLAGLEHSRKEASPDAGRYRTLEVSLGELGDVSHGRLSEYARKRSRSELVAQRALMMRIASSSSSVCTTRTRPRLIGPIA